MVIWVFEFSSGDSKLERFLPKNQQHILIINVVGSCQKLSIILVIKRFKTWCHQKCATKLVFFNENKEKDLDDFWHQKLTLKIKFLMSKIFFYNTPLHQISKFNNFLWVCWLLSKNISNFVPPLENFTTRAAILVSIHVQNSMFLREKEGRARSAGMKNPLIYRAARGPSQWSNTIVCSSSATPFKNEPM